MCNLKLAWRNLWRNRRRTLITSASIFFAVLFALFLRSLQLGTYNHMFQNAIESYSGYIQIQQTDFFDEKVVDNTFAPAADLESKLLVDENILATIPRFESFGLASCGSKTKGVLVMGIDPEKEQYLSKVSKRKVRFHLDEKAVSSMQKDPAIPEEVRVLLPLFEGSAYSSSARLQLDLDIDDKNAKTLMPLIENYCSYENGDIRMGEKGAWLGNKLAGYLELGIGDTIVILGQGYHASTAAGKYPVRGIVKLPMPDLDNKIVYLPLDICQQLYNAGNRLTSLALTVHKKDDKSLASTMERIAPLLDENQRQLEWKEMNELIIAQMDADNKGGMIMIAILYLVIAFGIFGTVLMLTAERKREFGVLVAIGMQKKKLASIISLELLLVGLLGILSGSLVALGLILYGVEHPLIFRGELAKVFEDYGLEPFLVFQGIDLYFLWQMGIVAIMVLIAIAYPLKKIVGMNVVHALRA